MKVALAAEMRHIDKQTVEEYGISGIVLMENAGLAVVREIESFLGNCSNKKVCIFVGKGNNGGDALVIARHLSNRGARVKVFLVGPKSAVVGDAQTNLAIVDHMDIETVELIRNRDWDKARLSAMFADCLVDGLLGTGIHGEVSIEMAKAISLINVADKPVFSIDIPTGIHADTGQLCGTAVKAAYTVTFGLPKPGLLLYPGAEYAGKVTVADIGIPRLLLQSADIRQNQITPEYVRGVLVDRDPAAHKGSCGRVLVIAGSKGLTGAAFLAASGALRAGAGLVTLGVAASLHDIMEVKLTEVMTQPLPDTGSGALARDAAPVVSQLEAGADVLAIGPGLGRDPETMEAVQEIIGLAERPLVIDADALYALDGCIAVLVDSAALAVVTPHPGEMARLTGLSIAAINANRIAIARQAAGDWGSIVVLKGAHTVVAFPDGEIYINTTGNAGMSTGGTGDVLTGVIAGLIAQGLSSHDAAVAGVYLHGLAGDMAAQGGGTGLLASEILLAIPAAAYQIRKGML